MRTHYRICFRCIASCIHVGKDCKCTAKCSECQSEIHLTALHAGTPPKPKDPEKEAQGGEEKDDQRQGEEPNQITTTCTEICGNTPGGKSCSKIFLAKIYVNGKPNAKIKAYVVIEDQSNRLLAKSQVFERLKLDGEKSSYTMRTCAGTAQIEGNAPKTSSSNP